MTETMKNTHVRQLNILKYKSTPSPIGLKSDFLSSLRSL